MDADEQYLLVYGVPNSGKTAASVAAFIWWSLLWDNKLFGVSAKEYKHVVLNLMPEIEKAAAEVRLRPISGKYGFSLGKNDYIFLSANNLRQKQSIQSFTFHGLFVDEVVNLDQLVFEEMEKRVRGSSDVKLWMTANPDHQNHWFKRHYVDVAEERGLRIEQLTFADNPLQDSAFVKRMSKFTGARYRQAYLGEWASPTGLIYMDVNPPVKPPDRAGVIRWYVSIDPAESGTAHALLIALIDGVYWVMDEWTNRGSENPMGHSAQAMAIREWLDDKNISPSIFIVDPASPNMLLELHNAYQGGAGQVFTSDSGVYVVQARNDVLDGIYATQSWLAHGALRLSDQAPALWEEMQSYVWDAAAAEQGITRPMKWADHGCDALRYFVYTVGTAATGQPIEVRSNRL